MQSVASGSATTRSVAIKRVADLIFQYSLAHLRMLIHRKFSDYQMPQYNKIVYNIATGDATYPHSGNFTIRVAGKITVDDSNGAGDAIFGDLTHTGGFDAAEQDVVASTVAGIDIGDTVDLRYKYTITGSDGSSGTVYFIATNGTADYGRLMLSNFPLRTGVTYTFRTFNTDGATAYANLVPCFTSGTFIAAAEGDRLIDDLKLGDLIKTRDHGLQPLRWIGRRTVLAKGKNAPILIKKGVLGEHDDLVVSQNHRMLIVAAAADLYFGTPEVLVAAKHLLANKGVSLQENGTVTYFHLLFDQHQIITANGAQSESFFPGENALNALEHDVRQEVLALFPELAAFGTSTAWRSARPVLNRKEAAVLNLHLF